ncbi:filamentous hemagglutinin [Burkholderia ubonensis]|uniref:two-partner secretion domain-containing protein n=1 Tax=Burkholderia ubonensis TaxID=101571 RepID=UPI000757BE52|nr:GLUG motif-containing protein [Burkholderia ubonensis]KVM46612.1 filamentous hemagglutinin [Burkholderia ubonensis]
MNKTYALVWNHALGCWNAVGETTRRRGKSGGGKLVAAGAVSLLGLAALPAHALPTGHAVVAGQADIATSADGKTMSINQHSDKLITNWQDFGVAGGERVSFQQPGSSSIALNRVIGTHGSQIDGRIDANGKVFLVNPNGVMFGAGSQVNVGSLVASTQNLSDADFLAGNYRFAGASAAAVVNAGSITAADGGSVALLGARVSNTGVIQAKMGRVALGAGQAFKVNFDGSDLLSVQVEGGAVDAQASNGGLLKADGGEVLMTARAAGNLLNAVVNNTGAIEARGLTSRGGRITLDGDAVLAGGKLDASATAGHGGDVTTRGTRVRIADDATVDTRGANGRSGTWKIDTANARVADDANATIGAAALSRNLGTTSVELTSTDGALTTDGAIGWNSDHDLTLTALRGDVNLGRSLTASGANARVAVNAARRINVSDKVALTGQNASLALNSGDGHALGGTDSVVTLSGANASFSANGNAYRVIHTADQLRAVDADLNGRYVLGNTIKGSGAFRSIGGDASFLGTFDGLGNTIGGLSVYNTGPYVGLFAVNQGTIANLTLDALSVRATANHGIGPVMVGSLVGANIQGTLSNVNARNVSVTSGGAPGNVAGGLVGLNLSGTIDRASVSGRVEGDRYTTAIGGLVGQHITSPDGRLGTATLTNSTADSNVSIRTAGTLSGNDLTGFGGLVGFNSGDIRHSSSKGSVSIATVNAAVGGLVGRNEGRVTASDASGSVTAGTASIAGALVGVNAGAIDASHARGNVTAGARSTAGGLAGLNVAAATIDGSTGAGAVAVSGSDATAGGLVGRNDGRVTASDASGSVSVGANGVVGGLVGNNGGLVDGAHAYGDVVATTNGVAGGLVGSNGGRVNASDAHGVVTALGNAAIAGGLVGLNRAQIDASNASGNVVVGANAQAGGLVGRNASGGAIAGSTARGNVGGTNAGAIGGLAGVTEAGSTITASSAHGAASGGANSRVGGFVGINGGHIVNGEASGTVAALANSDVGGLIGRNTGTVESSRASGTVTAADTSHAGGLIGFNNGAVQSSHASGAAAAGDNSSVGGLVGNNEFGSIALSGASGNAKGGKRAEVGGLVGSNGGRISQSSSSGTVSGGLYAFLGGIAGTDFGSTRTSSTSSRIAYTQGYGQRYGGLAGLAMTSMRGNTVVGDAAKVPLIGVQLGDDF